MKTHIVKLIPIHTPLVIHKRLYKPFISKIAPSSLVLGESRVDDILNSDSNSNSWSRY